MDEKEQKLRLTLEKNLQKAFKMVQLSLVSLEATLKDSSAKVSSLVNLLEQYEICHAVDQRQIPFHNSFPDLRLRLLVKLSTHISDKQDELRRMIFHLKDTEEKMTKYHKSSLGIISRGISLSAITSGTPSSPPLADMVEWLEIHSRKLSEQYYYKLHLLDEMMEDKAINSTNLLQMWTDQDDILVNSLKDTLAFVGPSLEEKR